MERKTRREKGGQKKTQETGRDRERWKEHEEEDETVRGRRRQGIGRRRKEEPVEEEEEPYEGMVPIVEPEEEDHRWASSGLLWIPIASSSFSSQKNSSLSR